MRSFVTQFNCYQQSVGYSSEIQMFINSGCLLNSHVFIDQILRPK